MIEAISVRADEKVLEIGSGSGIVSIHCALEGADVTAVDINEKAVEATQRNARRCAVSSRIKAFQGDLFSSLGQKRFDVIIFNPPYLVSGSERGNTEAIELAWEGGENGTATTERFLTEAGKHLEPAGRIYILLEQNNRPEDLIARFPEFRWIRVAQADFFFEHLFVYMLDLKNES